MVDRLWWFVTGLIAGGLVTIRALRRRPTAGDLAEAAITTTADVLELTARAVRPNRNRDSSRPR